jgi:hypothetical protein
MHCSTRRALSINEVFTQILSFAMSGMERCDGQRTVAAVAATCHDFTEPALDVLWAEQSSLSPLIKRIPICVLRPQLPTVRTMHASPIRLTDST